MSTFADMNASLHIYITKTEVELLSELRPLINPYLQSEEVRTLDVPSALIAGYAYELKERLSTDERLTLLSQLLPYARQRAVAFYTKASQAEPIKRIVADLDGCLVADELLPYLAQETEYAETIETATKLAMEGKQSFRDNFTSRVALLAGIAATRLEELAYELRLAPGVELLCHFTEGEAIRLDIASSNLIPYVHHVARRFGADEYIGTIPSLDSEERLTGALEDPIITDREKQAFALNDPYNKCKAEETLCIGDGANDLLMLSSTAHSLLYSSLPEKSLNIAHLVADIYFRGAIPS